MTSAPTPPRLSISARIARFALDRPGLALGLVLGVTLILGLLGLPPKIEGDLIKLLPEDDPAAIALQELRSAPGGESPVVIAVKPGVDLEALAAEVEALDSVRATFHALDPEFAQRLALLALEPAKVHSLAARLKGAMINPNPFVQGRLLSTADDLKPELPALFPPDVLVVIPAASNLDAEFCVRLSEELETVIPDPLWVAGPHMVIAESVRGVKSDLAKTSGLSLAIVLTVLILAFRSKRIVLLLFPPLILAVVVSLSLMQLAVGSINTYTSMGSAVLFGLGIDFGVHLVARYREERGRGLDPDGAVMRAWQTTGPPCSTAAWTSAAGFLTLALADFRGLSQLGYALSIGVMVCLLFSLVLLPILLVRLDPSPTHDAKGSWGPEPNLRRVLPICLVGTLLMGFIAQGVELEYDLGALRDEGSSWSEMTLEQQAWQELAWPPIVVTTEDRVAERVRLQAMVDAGDLPQVRQVLSVETLIPEDQASRLEVLAELMAVANDPRMVRLPPPVVEALQPLVGLELRPLGDADLGPGLGHLLHAGHSRVLMLLEGNMLDMRRSHALRAELEGRVDKPANEFLAHASMYSLITTDLPRITLAALFAVGLLSWWDLRSLRLSALAVGGLLIGLVWAGAGLASFQVRINFVNVVALPILMGIGIDVVIHMLHRLETEGVVGEALRTTGVAALISTLTTLGAFAALNLASNRGVQSIGQVVVIGLALVFVATITLVPAAWQGLIGPLGQSGADGPNTR